MALEVDDKTEQPTERRRRQAREDGLGPRSVDLGTACRLVGVALALQLFGGRLVVELTQFLTDALQRPPVSELTMDSVGALSWDVISRIGLSFLGGCGCLWVCCLAAHFLQVGFRFQAQDVLPDFSRLSLPHGMAKLWQLENVNQAGWGLLKYLVIVSLGGWYLWTNLGRIATLSEYDLATCAQIVGTSFVTLAWLLAAVFLVFGMGDYGYQLWKFEQSLKMSPAELREELRNEGGSANWKQQRRDTAAARADAKST